MRKSIYTFMIVALFMTGCSTSVDSNNQLEVPVDKITTEYKTESPIYGIDKNNLLTKSDSGLTVVDLIGKRDIKRITIYDSYRLNDADIYGDIVVWSDNRNEKGDTSNVSEHNINGDIFMYNIQTDEEEQITKELSPQISPKVWKNYIIYADNKKDILRQYNGKWSLYLYDLNSSEERLITSSLAVPGAHSYSIRDNKIVWEDDRNYKGIDVLRGGGNIPENNKDIYMYDISTGKETAVATGLKMESSPDVDGDFIVYEDRNNGTYAADIILYNMSSNEKINLTKDEYNQETPRIFGEYVVWMDERRGISTNDVIMNGKMPNSDIFLYDIRNKKERILTGDEPQIMPYISSDWVVYTTSRQINGFSEVIKYK